VSKPSAPDHPILFIPGPTEVHPDVARAGARPMIGHRGPEIGELLRRTLARVAPVMGTSVSVFPLACSATGAMEGAVRNAAPGRFLHLVCGAFSERWASIRQACALDGDVLEVPWGQVHDPGEVRRALRAKRYHAVTLVHNETSTGVMNPLPELALAVKEQDDVLLLVDTVSSMAAVELRLDEWGVDVCFAGTQKAWGLPPGMTLCAVSPAALRRSAQAPGKGYYFDWVEHQKYLDKAQTPATPAISLLYQLEAALDRIESEGLPSRYARHRAMRDQVLTWAQGRFPPFAQEGFRSVTLTTLRGNGVDLGAVLSAVRKRGYVVGGGYGKTKGEVFRVGHMGEITPSLLREMLAVFDEELATLGGPRS
jgi:aspartate aminotransferase-like enzyme